MQERVRYFIWLVYHDRLLTNTRMHKMHFGPPSCTFCQNEIKTTLHVLRDCPLTKVVWSNILDFQLRDRFFVEDLESWIGLNLDGSMRWSSRWITACYFLWFGEIKSCMKNPSQCLVSLGRLLSRALMIYERYHAKEESGDAD